MSNTKDDKVAGFELIPRFNSGNGGVSLIFPKDSDYNILTGDEVTNEQLRCLFTMHCECRPLDMTRSSRDHAAIHDCDTGILNDIQVAVGIIESDSQAVIEARERCAQMISDEGIPSAGVLLSLNKAQELAFALLDAVDRASGKKPMPWRQMTEADVAKADYQAEMSQYYAQRDDERTSGDDDGDR